MNTNETAKYPIDFDALEKGTYLAPRQCEDVLLCSMRDNSYRGKLLTLRDEIKSRLAARGLNVVIRTERLGLRILTDSEAVAYGPKSYRKLKKRLMNSHRDFCLLDRSKITPDEDTRYLKALHAQSFAIAGLRAKPTVPINVASRVLPGLPPAIH